VRSCEVWENEEAFRPCRDPMLTLEMRSSARSANRQRLYRREAGVPRVVLPCGKERVERQCASRVKQFSAPVARDDADSTARREAPPASVYMRQRSAENMRACAAPVKDTKEDACSARGAENGGRRVRLRAARAITPAPPACLFFFFFFAIRRKVLSRCGAQII